MTNGDPINACPWHKEHGIRHELHQSGSGGQQSCVSYPNAFLFEDIDRRFDWVTAIANLYINTLAV